MANVYTENAIEGRNLSVTCPYTFGEPTLLYFPGLNPIYCSDTMVIFYGFQTQKERTRGHTHVIQRSPVDPGFRNPYRPNVLRQ